MIFTYDYFKNLKRPDVYLAYPDKRIIGAIHTYDLSIDIMANSVNNGSFKVYRYENNKETRFYNEIENGRYLHLYGVGWFRISKVSVINEGINEYKKISYLSIECELSQTYLTSFGSLGTDDDDQGGLDRYCLYNPLDAEHSIIHIALQKNPGWSVKYIDPQISTEYRSFQEDRVDTYKFLTGKVSETYECVFLFDSYERSISAYKLENLGKDTGITLNYRNVIKSITMDTSEDDIKTVLTVIGGNDERTNTPLGIHDVSISGTNQIYDFSYFLHMMTPELRAGLKRYNDLCKANESAYQNKMSTLLSRYDELNTLKNKVPDEGENSTDWTKFGLRELQEKEIIYKTNMSLYLGEDESALYQKNATIHAAIETEIKVREQQISKKESEINNLISEISKLIVSLPDVLGTDLYKELGPYIREDTLTDDSFVVTNSMTDREILEMQQALLEHGRSELRKVSYPQYTLDIDLINFTVDYDYKRFTDALEMFNIIHINFEDRDSIISARLLKLHFNWDDPSDFKVTFSNRNSLKETWALFEEVKKQAEDNSSKLDYSTGAWKNAAIVSVDVNKYMNNILDASKQQLVSNSNNEVKIDSTGIMCRKWLEDRQTYDPKQIWITNNQIAFSQDSFNSVGIALGYVKMGNDYFYGLCAPAIVGKLLMSEKLIVSNESGSYTIDKNGFVAKQGSYQVKINPDTPSDIFSISIDDKKLLYVDTSAKALTFEGKLISKSGQIADFSISDNTLISGNVGISSDKTSGAVAYWAGNSNRNSAPFKVTNTGALTCSNATITGGSLKIGTKFSVNSSGDLTCSNATITGGSLKIGNNFSVDSTGKLNASSGIFTGEIYGDSGRIAGWVINGNGLYALDNTDSSIEGGRINIGPGFFEVNKNEIILGDFIITNQAKGNRGVFKSSDDFSGLSSSTGNGNFCLWAGYSGGRESEVDNYAICVNEGGQTYTYSLIAHEVHGDIYGVAGDSTTSDGWTIGEYLDWIYRKLDRLQDQIDNIDVGGV